METIEKGLASFVEIYDQKYKDRTVPYDGIPELMEELSNRGISFAVNSNKRTDYTNALVDKFFSHLPFIAVFGEREGVPKKAGSCVSFGNYGNDEITAGGSLVYRGF